MREDEEGTAILEPLTHLSHGATSYPGAWALGTASFCGACLVCLGGHLGSGQVLSIERDPGGFFQILTSSAPAHPQTPPLRPHPLPPSFIQASPLKLHSSFTDLPLR